MKRYLLKFVVLRHCFSIDSQQKALSALMATGKVLQHSSGGLACPISIPEPPEYRYGCSDRDWSRAHGWGKYPQKMLLEGD